MSGFKVNFSVNNQLATPSIHAAPLAQRPAFGQPGRVFIDTDSPSTGIYRDTGSAWVQIASTSSPEADTLQTVTDRGNTTTQDIAIGTSSPPTAPLDVHGSDVIAIIQASGSSDGFLQFNKSGSAKFKLGNVHNAGNDYFTVYNLQENSDAILVNISTNNVAIGGGVVAPSYRLDVQGSLRSTGVTYLATSGNDVGIGTTSPGTYLAGVAGATIFRSGVSTGLSIASSSSNYILQYLNGSGHFVKFAGPTAQRVSTQFLSTGNLNIGTSTADAGYKVDIGGTFRANSTTSFQPLVTATDYDALYLKATTPSVSNYSIAKNATDLLINTTTGGNIFFREGNSTKFAIIQSTLTNIGGAFSDPSVPIWIRTPTSGGYGIIISASASQTQNLFQFRDSSSAVMTAFTANGSLIIGSSTLNSNAILEAVSTTKGFLPPRMTTAQKNAIANTAGLVVFDTTLSKLCVNSGAGWETITSV